MVAVDGGAENELKENANLCRIAPGHLLGLGKNEIYNIYWQRLVSQIDILESAKWLLESSLHQGQNFIENLIDKILNNILPLVWIRL